MSDQRRTAEQGGGALGGADGQADEQAARTRLLFRVADAQCLLTHPDAELTRLRGNGLWQLRLLEPWLQTHGL